MPSVPPIQETPTRVPRGVRGCAFDDFADDLVAEDEGLLDEGEVAFEDVEVGAADSAGEDAEEGVAGGEGGAGMSSIWRGWLAVWRMAAFIWVAPSGERLNTDHHRMTRMTRIRDGGGFFWHGLFAGFNRCVYVR